MVSKNKFRIVDLPENEGPIKQTPSFY